MQHNNNFDLIRLIAALQVMAMHAVAWLEVDVPSIVSEVADWFPGVPIFFFVSGYLIVAAYTRSDSVGAFWRNRAVRIFPGLWGCLVFSFVLVAARGELPESGLLVKTTLWLAANGSLFQFAGAFGTGIANGSLWSIATELQFYILVPVAGLWFARRTISLTCATGILLGLIVLSGFFHAWVAANGHQLHPLLYPVLYSSLAANGYFFLFGVLAFLWRDHLLALTAGRGALYFVVYILIRVTFNAAGYDANGVHSSMLSVLVYPFLVLTVFAVAHSYLGVAKKLLRGNDFSYGLYVYHMPVVYACIYAGWMGGRGFLTAVALTSICAAFSWIFIEKPALKFKSYSVLYLKNIVTNGEARNDAC